MVDMHTSSEPDDQWEQHEPDWALHNTDSLLSESSRWTEKKNSKKFFLSWNTIKRLKKNWSDLQYCGSSCQSKEETIWIKRFKFYNTNKQKSGWNLFVYFILLKLMQG